MTRAGCKTSSAPGGRMEPEPLTGYHRFEAGMAMEPATHAPGVMRGGVVVFIPDGIMMEHMRRSILGALAILVFAGANIHAAVPVSLSGSLDRMVRQYSVAQQAGYAFARTPNEMALLEALGDLVRLYGNEDYGFREGVRSMLARPEMAIFITRLARDYRAECGEKLVVTSLTRPLNRQPRNAHPLSVHPAGIAVDLRVSRSAHCRVWLEATLLALEEEGLLDGIRERSPPHYHVALFPDAYMDHIRPVMAAERSAERARTMAARISVLPAGGVGAAVVGMETDHRPLWRLLAIVPAVLMAVVLIGHGSRGSIRP